MSMFTKPTESAANQAQAQELTSAVKGFKDVLKTALLAAAGSKSALSPSGLFGSKSESANTAPNPGNSNSLKS